MRAFRGAELSPEKTGDIRKCRRFRGKLSKLQPQRRVGVDSLVVGAVGCEPFSPDSLFNRENTGNYLKFGPILHGQIGEFIANSTNSLQTDLKSEQGKTGNYQGNENQPTPNSAQLLIRHAHPPCFNSPVPASLSAEPPPGG